jgi:transaldolase
MNNMLEHSRLRAVADLGQQIWLDNLSRDLLASGQLADLDRRRRRAGRDFESQRSSTTRSRTTPPTRPRCRPCARARRSGSALRSAGDPDVQRACDLFAPLYRDSDGRAGFVSFEVSPRLAHDVSGTIEEAKTPVDRDRPPERDDQDPGYEAGIAALEEVIYAGINVNVTLIFSASQVAGSTRGAPPYNIEIPGA